MGDDAVLKPHVSGEDYLETVLILQNKKVRYATLILSGIWGYAKYSISYAMNVLRNGGI